MTGFLDAAIAWLRFTVIFGVAAVVAGWPGLATARQANLTSSLGYRLQSSTGGQCVQAINRLQGDVLVNHCNECRKARIQYQRRGRGFPITRTFRIPEKGKVELSFKGSGESRVIADTPCNSDSQPEAGAIKNCAKVATRKNGQPALVNACPVCRGVVVERIASSGRRDRETFTLSPRTLLPLPLRGAARVWIVRELPCRR